MGVGEARIGGVAMGVAVGVAGGASRVWLGSVWGVAGGRLGCRFGVDVVRMSVPGSFWGVDRTEVLCLRRWEEVWAEVDDRAKVFRCDA